MPNFLLALARDLVIQRSTIDGSSAARASDVSPIHTAGETKGLTHCRLRRPSRVVVNDMHRDRVEVSLGGCDGYALNNTAGGFCLADVGDGRPKRGVHGDCYGRVTVPFGG
jgi:hypothetical protein